MADAKTEQLQIRVTAAQKMALKRLARRSGQDLSSFVLARALPSAALRLDAILRALDEPDSERFALAELNDLLVGLGPAELVDVMGGADVRRYSPYLQNYVAAMVELASQRNGVAPPAWVRDVEPLEEPRFVTPLASLRLHLLRSAPVPFRRRNIFIDASIGDRV